LRAWERRPLFFPSFLAYFFFFFPRHMVRRRPSTDGEVVEHPFLSFSFFSKPFFFLFLPLHSSEGRSQSSIRYSSGRLPPFRSSPFSLLPGVLAWCRGNDPTVHLVLISFPSPSSLSSDILDEVVTGELPPKIRLSSLFLFFPFQYFFPFFLSLPRRKRSEKFFFLH